MFLLYRKWVQSGERGSGGFALGGAGLDDAHDVGLLHDQELLAGDRILFGKWSGTEVKLDGEDLIIMKESDIMGVIG